MIFLKKNHTKYDIDRKAKQFAGKEYMYMLDINTAHAKLKSIWNNI